MNIHYQPIGRIRSPFQNIEGMPIQPTGAQGIQGRIEVKTEFTSALQDLEGFSYIILLYHLHQISKVEMIVTPFLDNQPHGTLSTRAPSRPNPIGHSVVKLISREENIIHIENVDILDDTPLLDIKPYVPKFDHHVVERMGWLEINQNKVQKTSSDSRFK
ncbi:MAG TPA: tRNA (N6-threonylcarbamoyladenosine(37)-N6)-methyltransferase TrmO [Desulfohalobiaceae bacterium]|nr:tRNA (N6-threonylcarbamoyladenosine(37)-N6)-methyltransferase TrmO [Desulfohalobiaceae bacterium]